MDLVNRVASNFLKRSGPYEDLLRAKDPQEVMHLIERYGLDKRLHREMQDAYWEIRHDVNLNGGGQERNDAERKLDTDWQPVSFYDPYDVTYTPVFENGRLDGFNVEGKFKADIHYQIGTSLEELGMDLIDSPERFGDGDRIPSYLIPVPGSLDMLYGSPQGGLQTPESYKVKLKEELSSQWETKEFPIVRVIDAWPSASVSGDQGSFENDEYSNWVSTNWNVVVEIEWDFYIDLSDIGLRQTRLEEDLDD